MPREILIYVVFLDLDSESTVPDALCLTVYEAERVLLGYEKTGMYFTVKMSLDEWLGLWHGRNNLVG